MGSALLPPAREPPGAATTRYCRPFAVYMSGMPRAGPGTAPDQSSLPVSSSNARIRPSPPAWNTSPVRVTRMPFRAATPPVPFGPPRLDGGRMIAVGDLPFDLAGVEVVRRQRRIGRLRGRREDVVAGRVPRVREPLEIFRPGRISGVAADARIEGRTHVDRRQRRLWRASAPDDRTWRQIGYSSTTAAARSAASVRVRCREIREERGHLGRADVNRAHLPLPFLNDRQDGFTGHAAGHADQAGRADRGAALHVRAVARLAVLPIGRLPLLHLRARCRNHAAAPGHRLHAS